MKIKWKVSDKATGRYRSFKRRDWPTAEFNGYPAFYVSCDDEYVPANLQHGRHAELSLHVAVYDGARFEWRRFRVRFATLSMAKDYTENYIKRHPEIYNENFGIDPDASKKKVVVVYRVLRISDKMEGIYVDLAAAQKDYPNIEIGKTVENLYAEEYDLKG